MAPAIIALETKGFFEGGVGARDGQQGTFVQDLLAASFVVVGLIGGNRERRSRRVQHLFDDLAVMDLSAGHHEAQWPAIAIDSRMNFRGLTATTDADHLISPFAPRTAR